MRALRIAQSEKRVKGGEKGSQDCRDVACNYPSLHGPDSHKPFSRISQPLHCDPKIPLLSSPVVIKLTQNERTSQFPSLIRLIKIATIKYLFVFSHSFTRLSVLKNGKKILRSFTKLYKVWQSVAKQLLSNNTEQEKLFIMTDVVRKVISTWKYNCKTSADTEKLILLIQNKVGY